MCNRKKSIWEGKTVLIKIDDQFLECTIIGTVKEVGDILYYKCKLEDGSLFFIQCIDATQIFEKKTKPNLSIVTELRKNN